MAGLKTVGNPGALYGLTGDPQAQFIVDMVNGSGGTVVEGDVVICTDVAGLQFTTTTTASDTAVIGVVGAGQSASAGTPGAIGTGLAAASNTATYAASAVVPVVVYGLGRVQIASNTVAAKAVVASTGTAKQAGVPSTAGSVSALQALIGSFFAVAQEAQSAKDANNTIRCWIMRG